MSTGINLRIKGWRNRNLTLDLPRRLLLAGPNGTGKTNILDAIEVALTGEAPMRLGKSAARLVPYLSDAATTILEGTDPYWSACASFRRTAKSAKLEHAVTGTPPTMRPLFVDFDGFLDSPAERKRLLDGLLEMSEASVLAHAKAGAQEAARAILTPAMPTWSDDALALLPGLSDQGRKALTDPTREALDAALAEAKAAYTAAKGAAEVAVSGAAEATTRDPAVIAAEASEARDTLAKIEAQDRDSRRVRDRQKLIESRLAALRAVDPAAREALAREVQDLEAATPPGSAIVEQLVAKLDAIVARGREGAARYKAMAAGKCPTCGTSGPVLASAASTLRAELEALGKERDQLQAEAANAKAAHQEAAAAYQRKRDRLYHARAELARLPVVDPREIERLEAELAGLPSAFLAGEELEALRLRVQHLDQEAEVARTQRAASAVVSRLNLPSLEQQGKVFRAALKGWEQGRAAAAAEVVGPVVKRMAETLQTEVALDPEANWTLTVAGRPAESYSGGQRLALWGAFVAALCKPGDVLLCEAAEADLQRLGLLCSALEKCPASLVVVATHHEPTIAQALGVALGDWSVVNPADLSNE